MTDPLTPVVQFLHRWGETHQLMIDLAHQLERHPDVREQHQQLDCQRINDGVAISDRVEGVFEDGRRLCWTLEARIREDDWAILPTFTVAVGNNPPTSIRVLKPLGARNLDQFLRQLLATAIELCQCGFPDAQFQAKP